MIQLRDVRYSYDGERPALTAAALDISKGLTLVVGPNGAGKSTLLRMVAGVERPDHGSVMIDGFDVWRDEVAARRRLAYVPEHPELTPYATIVDVMRLVADLRGLPRAAVSEALDRVGLIDVAWRTVRELSLGQRRRALVAAALLGDPQILVLDEPLETMDAAMHGFICEWVASRRAAGAAVLVATHELRPFAANADAIIAVRGGTVRMEALPSNAAESERLARLESAARDG
ncbi:MAG TPA: ABC transporter ATP-binding protein [Gemmatimonadaceae bacterium]|nr:ABC transporter ATP-binding protein [Gemmatimonadaceae bacterium]